MDNQNPAQVPPVNSTPPVGVPPVVEIIPPQTDPQQTTPSGKFSLSPKIILVVLAFLIILVLGSGIYLSVGTQPKPTPKPTPTIVSKPTPTPDPTASWKTYTSPTFGYSLKYPAALSFSTSNYQGIGGNVNTDTWTSQDKSYSINVFSYKSGVNSKLEFNLQPQPTTTIQLANQTINKVVSVDETLTQVGPIKSGNNEYMIVYTFGSQKNIEGLSLFNQILSTFKFTQSSS